VLKLIYENKSKEDIVFIDETSAISWEIWNCACSGEAGEVAQYTCRLTDEILKKDIGAVVSDNQLLICRPSKFIEKVAGAKSAGPPFAQRAFGGTLKEIGFKQR
jgi:hypothetical protein